MENNTTASDLNIRPLLFNFSQNLLADEKGWSMILSAEEVDDLPEFLDRKSFMHHYGGIKDPRFISEMHKIEARVSALPVLR